jgi:hypothetical protein
MQISCKFHYKLDFLIFISKKRARPLDLIELFNSAQLEKPFVGRQHTFTLTLYKCTKQTFNLKWS